MQPGSQAMTGELNTLDDTVGDERYFASALWLHIDQMTVIPVSSAAFAILGCYVTNRLSHVVRVTEDTV